MKSFVKFLVTLIVVALVGFVVYYVLIYGGVRNDNLSGDINTNAEHEDQSGEISNQVSGEHNPEIFNNINDVEHENQSGEDEVTPPPVVVDPIEEIDNMVQNIENNENQAILKENLAPEIIGAVARDFLTYFNQTSLAVTINVKPGKIEVIPDIDFLNNQVFYFDDNGNLILYESISNTVEGISKYYFNQNENIKIDNEYEEGVTPTNEDVTDILSRAKALFEKYSIK